MLKFFYDVVGGVKIFDVIVLCFYVQVVEDEVLWWVYFEDDLVGVEE